MKLLFPGELQGTVKSLRADGQPAAIESQGYAMPGRLDFQGMLHQGSWGGK